MVEILYAVKTSMASRITGDLMAPDPNDTFAMRKGGRSNDESEPWTGARAVGRRLERLARHPGTLRAVLLQPANFDIPPNSGESGL